MNLPSLPVIPHALRSTCMLTTAACLAAVAGCAHEPTDLERALGDTVRQARAQQAVPPSHAPSDPASLVTDGVIAVHGMDRYHQSWIRPPAPMTVLNIQAGGAPQGSPPAQPR